MAKRKRGNSISLDSFLDIMTCLVGLLVLIIILTALDASQVRVLIPTPLEDREAFSKYRPIYIECRNDQLFRVPVEDLRQQANARLREIASTAAGDIAALLQAVGESRIVTDSYEVEIGTGFKDEIFIKPIAASQGYAMPTYTKPRWTRKTRCSYFLSATKASAPSSTPARWPGPTRPASPTSCYPRTSPCA